MRSFTDYTEMRDVLLEECIAVESQWRSIRAFTQQTEDLAQQDTSTSAGLVEEALEQVRVRLRSSTIEIGIFGKVKRGKSTLLNALLGQVVSSMRVTPETAVPVWVERGSGPAEVWKLDGSRELIDDPAAARERMGQAHKRSKPTDEVLRVVQFVDVPWLQQGLRLVDTPGLSDPSMIKEYTELTLAEMDRVAAAIFVVVSPPGLDAEELAIVQKMASHGVDKAFLVCNFYSEQWDDPQTKNQVTAHIVNTLVETSKDGTLLGDELKVFQVNAKRSLQSALDGESESCGIDELRSELEEYLSSGALTRLTHRCSDLLSKSREVMVDVLDQRIEALADPRALDAQIAEHRKALRFSEAELDKITVDGEAAVDRLRGQLNEVLQTPFVNASSLVSGATRTRDLAELGNRLRIDAEAAASRASTLFNLETSSIEERLKHKLFLSYGIEKRINLRTGGARTIETGAGGGFGVEIGKGRASWTAVAGTAGTVAAAGGLAGGAIAGGIGIALIAAGPIGWLIGAGIGLGLGALAGGVGAGVVTRDSIQPAQRSQILEQIDLQKLATLSRARDACDDVERVLLEGLRDQRDSYFGEQRRELEAVEALRNDDSRRSASITEAQKLIDQIRRP